MMTSPINPMKQATITYPDGFPQILKMSDQAFVEELFFLAAAKLYELGQLSSGKAATLAKMERMSFLQKLSQVGVPAINLAEEEIEAEIEAAKAFAR